MALYKYLLLTLIALPWAVIRHNKNKKSFLSELFFCFVMVLILLFTGFAIYSMLNSDDPIYIYFFILGITIISFGYFGDSKRNDPSTKREQLQILNLLNFIFFAVLAISIFIWVSFKEEATQTLTFAPSPSTSPTYTLVHKTNTMTPSSTATPTKRVTSTKTPYPPSTNIRKTIPPTSTSRPITNENGCRSWNTITLSDVGKTICVTGTVRGTRIDYNQEAFFMTFGSRPQDFYMVTYGGYYFPEVKNECIYSTNKIERIGRAPVMVVDPYKLFNCAP